MMTFSFLLNAIASYYCPISLPDAKHAIATAFSLSVASAHAQSLPGFLTNNAICLQFISLLERSDSRFCA